MTKRDILHLNVGQWVQETLGARHGFRTGRPRWGRPRQVVEVEKRWKAPKGVAICFRVSFGDHETLRWVAFEGDVFYRVATPPTPTQLRNYALAAERNPQLFE